MTDGPEFDDLDAVQDLLETVDGHPTFYVTDYEATNGGPWEATQVTITAEYLNPRDDD